MKTRKSSIPHRYVHPTNLHLLFIPKFSKLLRKAYLNESWGKIYISDFFGSKFSIFDSFSGLIDLKNKCDKNKFFHFWLWKCNRNLAIFITLLLLSLIEMQRMKNEYTLISLTRGLIDIRRFMRYMIKTFCSTKLNGKQDNLNIDKDWWNICFIKNIHNIPIYLHNSCGLNKRRVVNKRIKDCIHKS